MELKNKIIASLVTLGIVGVGVSVGIDNACLDDKGITMFPAEELKLKELNNDMVSVEGKICFGNKADYEKFRDNNINTYKNLAEKDRGEYLWQKDGQILDDILDHEIKKAGKVELKNFKEGDDIFLAIINQLKL